MMRERPDPQSALRRRRAIIVAGLGSAVATLANCGGGGGSSSGSPSPPPSGWSPGGKLVYRNSSEIGVYRFATRSEFSFTPGSAVFGNPGLAVSRGGIITTLEEATPDSWNIVLYSLTGTRGNVFAVTRDLASPGSCAVISPDATKMAFSVNEPRSATDGTRIDRILIVTLATGSVSARIDGFNEPLWAGSGGQLMARNETSLALRLFDAAFNDAGAVGGIVLDDGRAVYDVSPDGRYVVYTNNSALRIYDRNTGSGWKAAQNNGIEMLSPAFSPDGLGLALLDQFRVNYEPHVAPWQRDAAVTIDDSRTLDNLNLAECVGRMGWAA